MFWKKNNPVTGKLISFHIPKTAGTSFSDILHKQYGEKLLKVYEQPLLNQCKGKDIPVETIQKFDAVHGHFMASQVWLDAFPNAHFVLWIRDPYERLYSHYTFWSRIKAPGKDAAVFRENKPSLLTFCTDKTYQKRNRIYEYFLQDFPIDKLSFVGEMSSIDQDMRTLAAKMKWRDINHLPKRNTSPDTHSIHVTDDEKKTILEALAGEYEIYRKLLSLRKQLLADNTI